MQNGWSPRFLVIGAMKAASTWLHGCLIRHPELAGPTTDKELHFFDEPSNFRRGLQWYRSQFREVPGIGVGESTPAYMHTPEVTERVKEAFPGVSLLASLRHPAERAFSHYRYSLYVAGRLSLYGTFEEALEKADELLEFGRYGKHLSRWLDRFPREQMHLILYDDIKRDPAGVMRNAYRFLELKDLNFRTELTQRRDHATGDWSLKLSRPGIYRQALRMRMVLMRIPLVERLLRGSGAIRAMRNFLRKGSERVQGETGFAEPVLLPETRALITRRMEDDILRLQDILQRDLSSWLEV